MSQPLRIGMIGLDTSHVGAFARLIMDANAPDYVGGGQIVAAFPGGSPDFDLSIGRVDEITKSLADDYSVAIVENAEAVAEQVDLVIIHSVDGRVHREQFEQIIKYRRPTFIDKPFTVSTVDAVAILDMAKAADVPVMSCSPLRYADALTNALNDDSDGQIMAVDVWGPLEFVDTQPGYFWYGVHAFEMVVAVMGIGCKRVKVAKWDQAEVVSMQWGDGRTAIYRGQREGSRAFGAVIHREKGTQLVDIAQAKRSYYASMIEAILASLPEGRSDIDAEEMLEVVRVIELANEARAATEVTSATL
jgi:predicted dehydrogenase